MKNDIESMPLDSGNRIEQNFVIWLKKMSKICNKLNGLDRHTYIEVDWV